MGIPSSRNTKLHHYPALFLAQQKYCLEGDSNPSILPSQLTNSRTAYIHEEITKKENKLHEKPTPVADLVPGQPIWHQDPLTKKWLPGAAQEKLQEPHSFSIVSQDTTHPAESSINFAICEE